jgi:hypothetical protein
LGQEIDGVQMAVCDLDLIALQQAVNNQAEMIDLLSGLLRD